MIETPYNFNQDSDNILSDLLIKDKSIQRGKQLNALIYGN